MTMFSHRTGKSLSFRLCLAAALLALAWPAALSAQQAEEKPAVPSTFRARAMDAVTLDAKPWTIHLWGVETLRDAHPGFKLKARTALDNAVGNKDIRCDEIRGQRAYAISAQCNAGDMDLGLFMIQQGFATVDRTRVYGTVFEEPYIQAEIQAQDRGMGIWADQEDGKKGGTSEGGLMISFGFILFLCIIAAFAALSIIIMRGFKKVIDAQNDNVEMMFRERRLREKEREIVAAMLDSEMKINKSKIEAFLVVYDEVLTSLKDSSRAPKYKRAGDIIQKQPALDRSVFDRNTDKLDILGRDLASDLIHFYARIKTNPDYVNLEPETDLQEAIQIVQDAVQGAKKLDNIAQKLIEAFQARATVPMQD